ncbi:MAG TPA: bifunctional glutamate N-acetyltransferase/amino-acid acetyltransferase ArgJ [Polyangiaceae bacterium]|nr:bifunctional glutamate N-acetyltransferase/amino-acid acetyltransferase ArgJ [Polyangiaceae bacterium]
MNGKVLGFRFGAVSAGIRKDGRIDLALAVCDRPAVTAALFTRNLVRAAPVLVAAERARAGVSRAVLANSGCANAVTGEQGMRAALSTTQAIAKAIGVSPEEVLPASTGVIGAQLPAEKINAQAAALAGKLTPEGHEDFAQAICTTDRWVKIAEAEAEGARVLAIGKGAGMIHPDVGGLPHATMLVFIFTDALVEQQLLARALTAASDETFNSCSVDGDTSTNDTVVAMASGASEKRPSEATLTAALTKVCEALARSMIADGEGANHVAEILVRGLASRDDARAAAKTIATSLLVKTMLFGEDANWGRLLAAAGRAGVTFDPRRAAISIGGIDIVKDGMPIGADAEARANEVLKQPSYTIELVLGDGPGQARYLTNDLGHGYVDVNAGYRS